MFCWASLSSCFSSFACRFMKKEGYCIEISVSQSKNGKENSKGTSVLIFSTHSLQYGALFFVAFSFSRILTGPIQISSACVRLPQLPRHNIQFGSKTFLCRCLSLQTGFKCCSKLELIKFLMLSLQAIYLSRDGHEILSINNYINLISLINLICQSRSCTISKLVYLSADYCFQNSVGSRCSQESINIDKKQLDL